MENLYKTILHSKRANIYYLEHCRILVNGGRVEYVTDQGKESFYWNIPIANTTCLLLGSGTSITQAAVRELAAAGVMMGFCGGNGTPLFAATEIEWLSPQSEYRPTEYLQQWCSKWFDDKWRFQAALSLQNKRLNYIEKFWAKHDWQVDMSQVLALCQAFRNEFKQAKTLTSLLTAEGRMSKSLYSQAIRASRYWQVNFVREHGKNSDKANQFLDHGNYLAYGLAASACWVLGLPHGLAVLHGKTRRGGLVFDIADLIKDAVILPLAFISAQNGVSPSEFRIACTDCFTRYEVLDLMIDSIKEIAASEWKNEHSFNQSMS